MSPRLARILAAILTGATLAALVALAVLPARMGGWAVVR